MWDRLGDELDQRNGEFILGVGDQVYVDGNANISIWEWLKKIRKDFVRGSEAREPRGSDALLVSRHIPGLLGAPPGTAPVLSGFPTYMMWDGPEILDGWGSYTTREKLDLLNSWWDWGGDDRRIFHF